MVWICVTSGRSFTACAIAWQSPGCGSATQGQTQTQGLQIVSEQLPFFRRRPLVDAEQGWMLGTRDEVGRAHVGGQHALFNQAVRIGAHARGTILAMRPLSSQTIWVSVVSKSTAPDRSATSTAHGTPRGGAEMRQQLGPTQGLRPPGCCPGSRPPLCRSGGRESGSRPGRTGRHAHRHRR